jgi:predicted glycosyltransferase
MKIWFDITNSPHINMFYDLIRDLEQEGHTIIITSRPLANTVALLDQRGLKHTVVGEHYGKNFYKKIMGYPVRVIQLKRFLKKLAPDIAISQSSFHSPVAARLLGIPSIYMNDNEHAMGNIPSFICATRIMVPEFLNTKKIIKQGGGKKKIIKYPGVKEGIYLWQTWLSEQSAFPSNDTDRKTIYIRPEPRTAQYYKGGLNFLDNVIADLKGKYKITILTRDEEQLKYYNTPKFEGVSVPDRPSLFNDIARDCLMFIGAGGTMTREMAVIGIPTISVYQDELLDVDRYLIQQGLMKHMPDISTEKALDYIGQHESKTPNRELLIKGRESYNLIKSVIKEIGKK